MFIPHFDPAVRRRSPCISGHVRAFLSDEVATCAFHASAISYERRMKARIRITLKNGVLDPQGKAIQNALSGLGFKGVEEVRQGKYIEVDLTATDEAAARAEVEKMCQELLANTVIEDYAFELSAR
jgi:phosphoribosylformylglycinamidine synthase